LPASDRLAIQTRDTSQTGNPTTPDLLGEKADQQPTHPLVADGQQQIECTMLRRHRPAPMFAAIGTFAAMHTAPSTLLNHEPTSVPKIAIACELIIAQPDKLGKLFLDTD
jgi:hypothetical protein